MIKVLVVDDHDLVRMGISRMLSDVPGLTVVGEADSGEKAIELARALKPDVVLMDVRMPGIGGLEATRKLISQNKDLKVVAVTVCDEEPFPTRLMQAGATGYVTKGAALDEMVTAIRKVHGGQRYMKVAWINRKRTVALLVRHPDRRALSLRMNEMARRFEAGRAFLLERAAH